MNHILDQLLTATAGGALVKALDVVPGLFKTKTDRATSRETLADGATKTALDALQRALDELRKDVEAETGKRVAAETRMTEAGEASEETIKSLHLAVDTLAERIEEQNRELADQPKLKAENARQKRQVADLQKQVAGLKARILDLEQTRAERVQMETEILIGHSADIQEFVQQEFVQQEFVQQEFVQQEFVQQEFVQQEEAQSESA